MLLNTSAVGQIVSQVSKSDFNFSCSFRSETHICVYTRHVFTYASETQQISEKYLQNSNNDNVTCIMKT